METCIIIPALRERDNLARLLPELPQDVAAVVVDDNSQDGTAGVVARFPRVHLITRTGRPGYGSSILDGLRWASAHGFDRIATMDADFSHDPRELPAMVAKLDGADVVIGSRYVRGGAIRNWSWYRRLLSRFANWYVRTILRTGMRDSTSGFVAYRRAAVEVLLRNPPAAEGYAFLVASRHALVRVGLRIAEYPITYTERREGESKMSFKNIWESVWLPWKLRFGRIKK